MGAIKNLITGIEDVLQRNGFNEDEIQHIFDCWNEPHRFYHNESHLLHLVHKILQLKHLPKNEIDDLIIVAVFHDIVYNPKMLGQVVNDRYGLLNTGWNETESIMKFSEMIENKSAYFDSTRAIRIMDIIAATGRREEPGERLAACFHSMDNEILESSFDVLMEYEIAIQKEFQFAPWPQYQKARIDFLRKEAANRNSSNLIALALYVQSHRPNIAIYPGSFNPFHKGHLDILRKAEKIFDKVIIIKGVNPDKDPNGAILPDVLQFHEQMHWEGMTTDLMTELTSHSNVTLLRGLRNGKDLDYEVNQLRFMEEMHPSLSVCFIQCSKEYEHISSSAIRKLEQFSELTASKYKC